MFDAFVNEQIKKFYTKANEIINIASTLPKPEMKVVECLRGIAEATGKIKTLYQFGEYTKYTEDAIEKAAKYGIKELFRKAAILSSHIFDAVSIDTEMCVSKGYLGFGNMADKRMKQIEETQKQLTERIIAIKSIGGLKENIISESLIECGEEMIDIFCEKAMKTSENKLLVSISIAGWVSHSQIPQTICTALSLPSISSFSSSIVFPIVNTSVQSEYTVVSSANLL